MALALVAAMTGCASVSIDRMRTNHSVELFAPEIILVTPFEVPAKLLPPDTDPADATALRSRIARNLAERTVMYLDRHVAPARLRSGREPIPERGWLVGGRVEEIEEGNRALRAGLGFGLGESSFDTAVEVWGTRGRQAHCLLQFQTLGGSGKQPGVASGVLGGATVISTAVGFGFGSLASIDDDVERTAYEIAAVLSELLTQQGLHDPNRPALRAKWRGQLPTHVNPLRAVPVPLRDMMDGPSDTSQ